MARPPRSSALQELRTLHKARDVPALRQLYRIHGEELAEVAGVRPSGFVRLLERSDHDVLLGTAEIVDLAQVRARKAKKDSDVTRAAEAARELQRTARWTEGAIYLDVKEVLGDLLAVPGKYICLSAEGKQVLVERTRLARLRRLARRLDGLSVHLTQDALCFRWRGGRGGLNLHICAPRSRSRDDIFHVHLERPREIQRAPTPLRRFIGQVMHELGHLPTP